jgi:hypothetical protein
MSDQKEEYGKKDDSYEREPFNIENYSIEELIEENSNKIESNSEIVGLLDERADENERKINQMNIHLEMLADKLGDMYERVNTNKCLREYADSDEELSTESEDIGDKHPVELIGGEKNKRKKSVKSKKGVKSKKIKKQSRNIRKTRKTRKNRN